MGIVRAIASYWSLSVNGSTRAVNARTTTPTPGMHHQRAVDLGGNPHRPLSGILFSCCFVACHVSEYVAL